MWHGAWAPRVADTYNHSVHVTRAGHQQQYHIPKATEEVAFLVYVAAPSRFFYGYFSRDLGVLDTLLRKLCS